MTSTTDTNETGSPLSSLVQEAKSLAAAPHDAYHDDGETHVAVNSERNRPLYASRIKVYPKLVKGFFRRIKWAVMLVTLGIYYITPWIRWDRGLNAPDQAVLIDFPHRKFYFFFIEIWPQEVYYITGLLILASFVLFLVTSIAGRVWCGYACPQTVWTDLFVYVETWIEGDRNARIKLDKAPLSFSKIGKKISKHSAWLLIAFATGGAWVFYFDDAPTLANNLLNLSADPSAYMFIGLFAASTYLLGGLAREQVCTYMCPWPRIQGAMFDDDSLLVSYKDDRGEGRGKHKKGASWEGRGDCIDCGACVSVCPMGIDIRDGMQLECIQCALCIDACNDVMKKVDRPLNLIGYDTPANKERRLKGVPEIAVNLLRPRTVIYTFLLVAVSAFMLATLVTRPTIDLNVLRDRNPLFVQLSDGSLRNGYTIKVINKEHVPQVFRVSLEGITGATLSRQFVDEENVADIIVPPDSLKSVKFYITLPYAKRGQLDNGEADLDIIVRNLTTRETATNATVFRGPER